MSETTSLDQIIRDVNEAIAQQESRFWVGRTNVTHPILFFCFAPRSGSTLISQALASTGEFAYVSNFVARFWEAPAIALALEKELNLKTSYDADTPGSFHSRYGVTSSFTEPHEFGYFWNKHLPYPEESHFVSGDAVNPEHRKNLRDQVFAMMSVYEQPFFFKNSISGLNVHLLKKIFPEARFVVLWRDPVQVVQSLYIGRQKLYGDTTTWLSLKPSRTEEILERRLNPIHEICCQVSSIYEDIYNGISDSCERCLLVSYEDFCKNPALEITRIFEKLNISPAGQEWRKKIPSAFEAADHIKVEKNEYDLISQKIREERIEERLQSFKALLSE